MLSHWKASHQLHVRNQQENWNPETSSCQLPRGGRGMFGSSRPRPDLDHPKCRDVQWRYHVHNPPGDGLARPLQNPRPQSRSEGKVNYKRKLLDK